MEKIIRTVKRLSKSFFSLRNRKPKTSHVPKVLVAKANVLAYAYHEGYDTRPPDGFLVTIALARATDTPGLCHTLEKMGWLIHYCGENNYVDNILLNATADHLVSGTEEIHYVGLISKFGLQNLSHAGVNTFPYALPDADNELVENHSPLDDILPFKGVKK
jgi:hypothetical protein